jgi:hypothetical protein
VSPDTASDTLTVDQAEAARLTQLSAKTLDRLARRGERVGQLRVGRRLLYHRPTLERWVESQIANGRPDGA